MDKKFSSCVILTFSWISVTAGLQCPSCTYITMDAETLGPAKSIVEGMFASVQDEECAQDLKGPIPQIQEEKCEATTGQVPRCGFYKGSVTIKLSAHVTSVDVPLNIYKRGCNLFKTENVPSTGCHRIDNIKEDETSIEQILNTVFTTGNLVTFDGELCLCTDTYCRDTSSVSKGAKLETSGVSQGAKLETSGVSQGAKLETSGVSKGAKLETSSVSKGAKLETSSVSKGAKLETSSVSKGAKLETSSVSQGAKLETSGVSKGAKLETSGVSQGAKLETSGVSKGAKLETSSVSKGAKLETSGVSKGAKLETSGVSKGAKLETSGVSQGAKLETSGVSKRAKLSTISLCLSMLFCSV